MFTNCKAYAKIVKHTKHKTLCKLLVTFNAHAKITQRTADYVSGDLLQTDIANALANAQQHLRTNNIEIVV